MAGRWELISHTFSKSYANPDYPAILKVESGTENQDDRSGSLEFLREALALLGGKVRAVECLPCGAQV